MKTVISTEKAPAPVGQYSQGIITDGSRFVFTAGQVSIDPRTNEVVYGDIRTQARMVLENLGEILRAAGTDMKNMVKCTIFLTDLNNFPVVNELFEEFFPENPPARSAVQVAALPKEVDVLIEGIATVPV